MHVEAARELRFQPRDIACVPTGELLTYSWSAEGMRFEAYGADLRTLWSVNLGPDALGLRLDRRGAVWVVDRAGASVFNMQGEVVARMDAPRLDGMEVAALTFVGDDFVFAYQHERKRRLAT